MALHHMCHWYCVPIVQIYLILSRQPPIKNKETKANIDLEQHILDTPRNDG